MIHSVTELVPNIQSRIHDVIFSAIIGSTTGCTITEKAPTWAFSWLKAPTSAFTFKTLLRHYAKWVLSPRSLNVKLVRDTKVIRDVGSMPV